ncbi:MAG: HlyD family efflux transporter periplasmic adaptor subunit [Candidatus Pacebacteria bacterium]|nr:HlyD family efflux transporter periplasmic adaptor subunit [Candidatus Paceibacterota bacterium]
MNQTIKNIKKYFVAHKVIGTIVVLVILLGAYRIYKHYTAPSTAPRYVLGTVSRGTITTSVTGTGQVSASNQIELKAKASGDIVYLPAAVGQEIPAGTLIAQIDSHDAAIALETAQLALQKLVKPADAVSLSEAENALADAKDANKKATDDLAKAYDDSLSAIANSFLDFSPTLTGIDDILGKQDLSDNNARISGRTALDFRNKASAAYYLADNAVQKETRDYRTFDHNASPETVENILNETYDTAKLVSEATKDTRNFVDYMAEDSQRSSDFSGYQNTLAGYTAEMNGHVVDLLSIQNTISDAKNTISSSARSIQEKTEALQKIKDGTDELDVRSQELSVQQKEYAYEDYFIRAPFDGVLAKLDVRKGDSIGSGGSLGTFLSKNKIADISLNEVDVARIKDGQKVMLTFDAIDGLTISGEVVETDLVGTVTQGVVNYNVKIAFDTEDDRVKAGMSANAAIITDVIQDVLIVPNSAVKTQGNTHYVEMFTTPITSASADTAQGITSATLPSQQVVEIGTSNDTQTEITSGLKEGDQIVVRTITPSTTTTTAQAPSLFGGNTRAVTTGGARGAGR